MWGRAFAAVVVGAAVLPAAAQAQAPAFSASIATPISGLSAPNDLATGDVNGDGRPDIVTASAGTNDLVVAMNQGGGVFATRELPTVTLPVAVTLGDLNADG